MTRTYKDFCDSPDEIKKQENLPNRRELILELFQKELDKVPEYKDWKIEELLNNLLESQYSLQPDRQICKCPNCGKFYVRANGCDCGVEIDRLKNNIILHSAVIKNYRDSLKKFNYELVQKYLVENNLQFTSWQEGQDADEAIIYFIPTVDELKQICKYYIDIVKKRWHGYCGYGCQYIYVEDIDDSDSLKISFRVPVEKI